MSPSQDYVVIVRLRSTRRSLRRSSRDRMQVDRSTHLPGFDFTVLAGGRDRTTLIPGGLPDGGGFFFLSATASPISSYCTTTTKKATNSATSAATARSIAQ